MSMDKTYDPVGIETRWYGTWEERGYFAPQGAGDPYCIMLPPPNVTGSLHMGHAFQQTLMDILIRFHRMEGDNTLWQCGADHAGIATQMVVERQLEQQGTDRRTLGREAFVQAVWKWKEQSGNTITGQSRRLGASMDWSRERFTMDAGLSDAVREVFVRLHEDGLIYRGTRLVNWDPVLHTAISDLEVISGEEDGSLWHMRYPLADGSGHLVVATTRPETMLGDTAVAVNPGDTRYADFIGKEVELPLSGRRVPVIADEYVDPEFGTGCVKITPGHDFNDYQVGQRHDLPLINIFTASAVLNDNVPEAYRGLDRFEARKRVVADLEAQGLMERIEPHRLTVPRGDRSGAVVEPWLTDQWYVKVSPLAEAAVRAVEDGRIRFVPENWAKTYYEWMRNIQDWCVSRQLWWGHRIPAWRDEEGNWHVARTEAAARDKARAVLGREPAQLVQDEDVLDTWFSSALWPFSTLGWPERTPDLRTFYPTSVLVTGFDIIFFWVARMIMMGLKFMDEVPFREVYIHGLVRDSDGQKMSKSKGNILDPLDLIDGIELEALVKKRITGLMQTRDAEKIEATTRRYYPDGIEAYGTDALRFTFASLASPGRNVNFDVGRIGGHRNFCNKLWNAARYVMMNVEDGGRADAGCGMELALPERWIWSRLHRTIAATREAVAAYRFDLAAQAIHEFTWDEYCDWYLELSKPILTDADVSPAMQRGTRHSLAGVLEVLLRLAHPFIPFITEEIWQRIAPFAGRAGATIMLQPYPRPEHAPIDEDAERQIRWVKDFVLGIRRIRGELNIAPGKPLPVLCHGGTAEEGQWLEANRGYLQTLARLESLEPAAGPVADAATALAGEMSLFIPMAEVIDPGAERERLARELDGRRNEFERTKNKLANDKFVERAPKEVVDKERRRHDELSDAIGKLQHQIDNLEDLVKRTSGG